MLTIESTASDSAPVQVGSAQLSTDGQVNGFIRFRYTPLDQDALVPLETRNAAAYTLAFDNTGGIATGVALANLVPTPSSISVIIRDDTGTQIGSSTVALPATGHAAFILSERFKDTANRSGTIEFDTPQNGRITVLGLRFPPGGRFTTIPVSTNLDAGGGVLAHLAVGDGWTSTIELVNTGTITAHAHLQFFTGDGSPLPLVLKAGGATTTSTAFDQNLEPHQHVTIESAAATATGVQTGSAQLSTDGNVVGFIRFGYTPQGEEAIVPLESRNAPAFVLQFDNTGGVSTGVAISNLGSASASVPAIIRDSSGGQIGSGVITLPGNGHSSFLLSNRFLSTVNQSGTIEFDTPQEGRISVLGLRFNPSGAFSTIPVVVP
jgi:hypothetical protein